MRIGDAAARLGLPTHVLRHWEDMGVLVPERNAGGQREYDQELLTRGRLILLCQRAGLSLAQIGEALGQDLDGRRRLLEGHRAAIASRVEDLRQADAFLAHTLECRHPIASECPDCAAFAQASAGRDTGVTGAAVARGERGPRAG